MALKPEIYVIGGWIKKCIEIRNALQTKGVGGKGPWRPKDGKPSAEELAVALGTVFITGLLAVLGLTGELEKSIAESVAKLRAASAKKDDDRSTYAMIVHALGHMVKLLAEKQGAMIDSELQLRAISVPSDARNEDRIGVLEAFEARVDSARSRIQVLYAGKGDSERPFLPAKRPPSLSDLVAAEAKIEADQGTGQATLASAKGMGGLAALRAQLPAGPAPSVKPVAATPVAPSVKPVSSVVPVSGANIKVTFDSARQAVADLAAEQSAHEEHRSATIASLDERSADIARRLKGAEGYLAKLLKDTGIVEASAPAAPASKPSGDDKGGSKKSAAAKPASKKAASKKGGAKANGVEHGTVAEPASAQSN